ncbi:MAG: HisA/HisF-related TIM barrel protein, partial [Actinomycetota bacterium]|nr:HisA/HisF-related TIM barrel protein [Actinomycetota bacterium]
AQVLAAGAARVVFGTSAVTSPAFLREAVAEIGDRIAVAVDTDGEWIMVRGWTAKAGRLVDVLPALEEAGARRFLITSVSRDGTQTGPDLDLYRRIRELTDAELIASGGVRTAEHVAALAAAGLHAVVVGTALYEGNLTLEDAAAAVEAAAP